MIRGIHHVAVHVRDLDRMIKFYRDAFGFEVVGEEFSWRDTPMLDQLLDVPGSAARGAMLRAGSCYMELFEFSAPQPGSTRPLRPFDKGYTHFCVDVTDIEQEYERLTNAGHDFRRASSDGRRPREIGVWAGPGRQCDRDPANAEHCDFRLDKLPETLRHRIAVSPQPLSTTNTSSSAGRVFLSSNQALTRLPLDQARRDRAAGLKTARLYLRLPRLAARGLRLLAVGRAKAARCTCDPLRAGSQRGTRGQRDPRHPGAGLVRQVRLGRRLRTLVRQGHRRRSRVRVAQARAISKAPRPRAAFSRSRAMIMAANPPTARISPNRH